MALLTEQDILPRLPDLSASSQSIFWLAYSGGLDSQVLLHLMQKIIPASQLRALHIHHGLQSDADSWDSHCRNYCQQQNIDFRSTRIDVDATSGSLELQARQARYAVFESVLGQNDYLLMAHHRDDQLETVLYRLLRGSGPRGLAGIPPERPLGRGTLLRPLLNVSKQRLLEYARENGLSWVEDSSNQEARYDRNFLRHEIIPLLRSRWPEAADSVSRSAELCREAEVLLQDLADIDCDRGSRLLEFRLELAALQELPEQRQRNALRGWFSHLNSAHAIPLPGFEELRRLVQELIPAGRDAEPLVSWRQDGTEVQVRRFKDCLYVLKDFPAQIENKVIPITPGESIELGDGLGLLCLQETEGEGLPLMPEDRLEIRFRTTAKAAKPLGRKTRSLKKLYQDYQVPPWWRDRIPMLFIDGKPAAFADLFLCESERPQTGGKRYKIVWQKPDNNCGG